MSEAQEKSPFHTRNLMPLKGRLLAERTIPKTPVQPQSGQPNIMPSKEKGGGMGAGGLGAGVRVGVFVGKGGRVSVGSGVGVGIKVGGTRGVRVGVGVKVGLIVGVGVLVIAGCGAEATLRMSLAKMAAMVAYIIHTITAKRDITIIKGRLGISAKPPCHTMLPWQ